MTSIETRPILLIAGPTASGKSALGVEIAQRVNGEIVNADSMQVYRDLSILTARPTPEEMKGVAHHLFGHIDAGAPYSVGRWLVEALAAVADIQARGRVAVLVGGTGLYLRALTEGLAEIPPPTRQAEDRARAILNERGVDSLRAEAARLDPDAAAGVEANDRQRLSRIVAVALGTEKTLSEWRAETEPAIARDSWAGVVIEPERQPLYWRIEARAAEMMSEAARNEVRALLARRLPPDEPIMKALGVSQLAALQRGQATPEQTLDLLQRDTRRYAKRQMTWFRHQTPDWPRIPGPRLRPALAALTAAG